MWEEVQRMWEWDHKTVPMCSKGVITSKGKSEDEI